MKNANKVSGAAIATAAALLFSNLAVSTASAEEAKVHCAGVNACKGAGACKTAANECKGQNACKGKGFTELTDKECKAEQAKLKKG